MEAVFRGDGELARGAHTWWGLCSRRRPSASHQPCVSWGFLMSSKCWNPPLGWGRPPTTLHKPMHGGKSGPLLENLSQT